MNRAKERFLEKIAKHREKKKILSTLLLEFLCLVPSDYFIEDILLSLFLLLLSTPSGLHLKRYSSFLYFPAMSDNYTNTRKLLNVVAAL